MVRKFKNYREFKVETSKMLAEFFECKSGKRKNELEDELIYLLDNNGSYVRILQREDSKAKRFYGGNQQEVMDRVKEEIFGGSTASSGVATGGLGSLK